MSASPAREFVTAAQARELRATNRGYPKHLVEIAADVNSIGGLKLSHNRSRVLRSRDFLVQVCDEPGGIVRLSINRTVYDLRSQRWRDGITWDEIQRLKAEAGFGDRPAVEIFPPDGELVDVANVRHIWVLPAAPAFMWTRG